MHQFITKSIAVLVSVCLLSFPTLPAYAQAAAQQAGEVTAEIPQAQLLRPAETLAAAVGTAVLWNDLVETAVGGRVRITLGDGSILNVGSDSSLRVVQHQAQSRQTDLTLTFGKLRSRLRKLGGGERFELRTNTAVLGVIGTDFFVEATATQTRVIVYEGAVLVRNINAAIAGAVQVRAGQRVEVFVDQPPTAPEPVQATELEESVQETNVGEELPTPQVRVRVPLLKTKWFWLATAAAVAAVAIVVPTVTNGNGKHEATGCPVPPPSCP